MLDGRKRLLSLDGGGVLGLISLMILKKVETDLADRSPNPAKFALSDFFDYFGGTSTGAIIASGLATGMRVDDLIKLYRDHAGEIFNPSMRFYVGFRHRYRHDGLARLLRDNLGAGSIAELRESGRLKALLMIAARNATTESSWLISTNSSDPFADALGRLELWRVVRASAAAPYYFAPETIHVRDPDTGESKAFDFEDGGTTAYNNPALALFRHAVSPEHWAGHAKTGVAAGTPWIAGEEEMLLVSVGTGETRSVWRDIKRGGRYVWNTALEVPSDLMAAIATENDINCRVQGRCAYGPKIDSKLGDMVRPPGAGAPASFRYVRYNAEISENGLSELGLSSVDPKNLKMDSVAAIPDLMEIGARTAASLAVLRHFGPFAGDEEEAVIG